MIKIYWFVKDYHFASFYWFIQYTKLDQRNFPEVVGYSPNCETRMKSAQNSELVIVNRNQRCFDFVHTQVLHMLCIPSVHYIFLHIFNKTKPLLTNCRGALRYLGETVMLYASGHHFSLHKKGNQSIHFGISAQGDYFHSVDEAHAQTFLPKQIMASSECHVVMSQWCKGFQMMTFMSVLKGYKRKMRERVRVPILSLEFREPS